MPLGLNGLELKSFFGETAVTRSGAGKVLGIAGKSIQRSWNFYGTFLDTKFFSKPRLRRLAQIGPPPIVRSYHLQSVTVPTYNFTPEVMMYGQVPRTFPVLEFEGFILNCVFEDDENGTIAYMINWLQRHIIDDDGYYLSPLDLRIGKFIVEVQDPRGFPVVYYVFNDIYFLKADDVTYDYGSNESIKYSVSFGVDRMSTQFIKQGYTGIVGRGGSAIAGSIL